MVFIKIAARDGCSLHKYLSVMHAALSSLDFFIFRSTSSPRRQNNQLCLSQEHGFNITCIALRCLYDREDVVSKAVFYLYGGV